LTLGAVLASCGDRTQETTSTDPAGSGDHAEGPHWSYAAETGPATWGSLRPEYLACAEGTGQSPIDIVTASAGTATASLKAQYGATALSIDHHEHVTDVVDNGHTIQVNCAGAGSLAIGEERFDLVQFHFHSPSEHTMDGKSFPMEMHMVHKSADGKLAVMGTWIQEGTANPAFAAVWANLPAQKGQEIELPDVEVDVDKLLPKDRSAYRYDGSLTTPPCSEGVRWVVLKTPIELSAEQIGAFRAIISGNNRPPQALNGRMVVQVDMAEATGH
jgi:carbonic anhydrase